MKRIILYLVLFMALITAHTFMARLKCYAYSNSRMIDNVVFDNTNSMNEASIQNFLASKGPCLVNYSSADFTWNGSSWTYGGSIPASRVIYKAAQQWGINPQVIITTLQKEESLISGTSCDGWRYSSAMGYGCPDSGGCNSNYAGFTKQVLWGSWQLAFGRHRSEGDGNLGWDGDGNITYYGYMTVGSRARCLGCQVIYYDGNAQIDGQLISLFNGATASLYSYTPHLNQSFPRIFEGWFGPAVIDKCTDSAGPLIGGVTFRKIQPRIDQAALILYSGTSRNCIESHAWNIGVTSWASQISTNVPIADPANALVYFADVNGDGIDDPVLAVFSLTGSGRLEFHVWNRDMQTWSSHIISNLPQGVLSGGRIAFADVDGDGRDEPVLILMTNTASNKVEFHVWNNDMQTWRWHVASNLPGINTADGSIEFGDVDGDGRDEPVLIGYRNQGSGKVEFHTWGPGWGVWKYHTPSNLSSIDPSNGYIAFADVDGDGLDNAVLVGVRNTGSGRIEFHTWDVGVTSWKYHTASNLTSF